jgi:hypothetical protein
MVSITLRMSRVAVLGLSVLALLTGIQNVEAACCNPGRNWTASGIVTFRFDNGGMPLWNSATTQQFRDSANAWANLFAYEHSSVSITESSSGEWRIVWADLTGAWDYPDVNNNLLRRLGAPESAKQLYPVRLQPSQRAHDGLRSWGLQSVQLRHGNGYRTICRPRVLADHLR